MPGVLIEDVTGLVDPLKTYQFLMNISPIQGVKNFIGNDVLSLRCTATSLPGSTIAQIPVDLGGFTVQYAGRRQFAHNWSTVIIEGQDMGVMLQLASWMKLIYNQFTGIGSFKADHSAQAVVEMYNDPNEVIGKRTLYGCFPIGDPGAALSMAGGGAAITLPITWSFDIWDDDQLEETNTSYGG
jgi:hypothetical protein